MCLNCSVFHRARSLIHLCATTTLRRALRIAAAYLHENILSGNSVNALFAPTGPALNEHEYPPVHPPRPSFPAHLSTIQNQHPHGDDYWKGLQGDRADCPTISSCPARYGCYIQQKPGTRCSYCKCKREFLYTPTYCLRFIIGLVPNDTEGLTCVGLKAILLQGKKPTFIKYIRFSFLFSSYKCKGKKRFLD